MRGGLARGDALRGRLCQGLFLGGCLPADALGQRLHMHQVLQRHLAQDEEEVGQRPRIQSAAGVIPCKQYIRGDMRSAAS